MKLRKRNNDVDTDGTNDSSIVDKMAKDAFASNDYHDDTKSLVVSSTKEDRKHKKTKKNAVGTAPAARPVPLALALNLVVNLVVAAGIYSLLGQFAAPIGRDLRHAAAEQRTLGQLGALLGWRAAEVVLAWWVGGGAVEVASLLVVLRGPLLFLLAYFYKTTPLTIVASLSTDFIAAWLPFSLFKPSKPASQGSSSPYLTDSTLTIYTTLLSTSVYALILSLALRTFLPYVFVARFATLSSIGAAHDVTPFTLLPASLIFGAATTHLLSRTTLIQHPAQQQKPFDPSTASLVETFWWNLWGYQPQTRALLQRTALFSIAGAAATALLSALTIEQVDLLGAGLYAAVWGAAVASVGLALAAVAAV